MKNCKILDERAEVYLQHIEALNEMLNALIVNDFYCIRHLGIPQIGDEAIKAYRRTEGEALKVITCVLRAIANMSACGTALNQKTSSDVQERLRNPIAVHSEVIMVIIRNNKKPIEGKPRQGSCKKPQHST